MRTTPVNTEPIEALGLSRTEVRIYLAVLKLGSARAGALMKSTGIQNSVMHLTLGKLLAMGFISYVKRGKIREFRAADPRQLLHLLDTRRKGIESILPSLLALQRKIDFPEAEIYEGITGLRNMCLKLIENASPGDDFLFFGFGTANQEWEEQVYEFYREYTLIRIDRGLKLRGIAHTSVRKRFEQYKWPHRNIRFVNFPTLQNISICAGRVIIVPWDDQQISFLITSKAFADNLTAYFEDVWASSRQ